MVNVIQNEVWADTTVDSRYEVSTEGRVRNKKTQYILNPSDNGKGYKQIMIFQDGIRKKYYVHRLVGLAFLPNPENKPEIDHINDDRSDNRLSNLQWVTSLENNGKKSHCYRISVRRGTPVQCVQTGVIYHSLQEAERQTNIHRQGIANVCKGEAKSAGGYQWRYVDKDKYF